MGYHNENSKHYLSFENINLLVRRRRITLNKFVNIKFKYIKKKLK